MNFNNYNTWVFDLDNTLYSAETGIFDQVDILMGKFISKNLNLEISEAKKISTMAEAYNLPIAPHDCVGPITFLNSIHMSLSAPNAMIQETVRAYNNTWYLDIIETMPKIESGFVYAPEGTGIGTIFTEKFIQSKATETETVKS